MHICIITIITIFIIHHYRMHTSYSLPGQSEFKVLLSEKPASVQSTNQPEPALPKGSHPVISQNDNNVQQQSHNNVNSGIMIIIMWIVLVMGKMVIAI